jgi:hypothetical protein
LHFGGWLCVFWVVEDARERESDAVCSEESMMGVDGVNE